MTTIMKNDLELPLWWYKTGSRLFCWKGDHSNHVLFSDFDQKFYAFTRYQFLQVAKPTLGIGVYKKGRDWVVLR